MTIPLSLSAPSRRTLTLHQDYHFAFHRYSSARQDWHGVQAVLGHCRPHHSMRDSVVASLDWKNSNQEKLLRHEEDEVGHPEMGVGDYSSLKSYSSASHPIKNSLEYRKDIGLHLPWCKDAPVGLVSVTVYQFAQLHIPAGSRVCPVFNYLAPAGSQ